jgi:hypothetical protein
MTTLTLTLLLVWLLGMPVLFVGAALYHRFTRKQATGSMFVCYLIYSLTWPFSVPFAVIMMTFIWFMDTSIDWVLRAWNYLSIPKP